MYVIKKIVKARDINNLDICYKSIQIEANMICAIPTLFIFMYLVNHQ